MVEAVPLPSMEIVGMSRERADELRELMRLAKTLQGYVRETDNPYYTRLFEEASVAIFQRARDIANGKEKAGHGPVNIVC